MSAPFVKFTVKAKKSLVHKYGFRGKTLTDYTL